MAIREGFRSVLIVDDHDGFRARVRALLEADGYRVVGEAADGAEAIGAVGRLRPDVVLLDVHLPDVDGFEVARRIAAQPDGPAVVLVSSGEVDEFGHRMAACKARGFISKADLSGQRVRDLVLGAR